MGIITARSGLWFLGLVFFWLSTAHVAAASERFDLNGEWGFRTDQNESDVPKPAGLTFFRAMKAHINAVDPGRFVTFAADPAQSPSAHGVR